MWFADLYLAKVSSYSGPLDGETEIARYVIDPAAHNLSPQVLVQVKSNVTYGIVFDKDGPGRGRPVIPALKEIGVRVTGVFGAVAGSKL